MPRLSRRRLLGGLGIVAGTALIGSYLGGRWRALRSTIEPERLAVEVPPPVGDSLTVVSYNIAHGRGSALDASNWTGDASQRADRLAAIGGYLRERGADVVVLNEVDFDARWSGGIDQAAVIARAGGYPWLARQANYDLPLPLFRLRFGNAVLSRHPIVSAERVALPALRRFEALAYGSKDALRVSVDLGPGGPLTLWALHLEVRDGEIRRQAAEQLAALIGVNAATLVAGDLNDPSWTSASPVDSLGVLFGAGLASAIDPQQSQPTFPSERPEVTLDWILHGKRLQAEAAGVEAVEFSDHRPVWARFQLR